jgi:predicted kinase
VTIDPKLIIIRGNSGSGKSSIAREVRARYGRGCALIEQDYLRRIILKELDGRDAPGIAPRFIANAARFALDNGYHVILEGILWTGRYGDALRDLIGGRTGNTYAFYLDIPFDETVRRHATRPQVDDFTPDQMRNWYANHDALGIPGEQVIDESSTFEQTVDLILSSTVLLDAPSLIPNRMI